MVSNESIVTAIVTTGTIGKAAEQLGISPRTISDRMKDNNFQILYQSAKADIVRNAVNQVNSHLTESVNSVAEIMNDKDVNPQTRLQACKIIIDSSLKLAERLTKCETAVDCALDDDGWF